MIIIPMGNHGGFRGMVKASHETKVYPNIRFAYTSCKLLPAGITNNKIQLFRHHEYEVTGPTDVLPTTTQYSLDLSFLVAAETTRN